MSLADCHCGCGESLSRRQAREQGDGDACRLDQHGEQRCLVLPPSRKQLLACSLVIKGAISSDAASQISCCGGNVLMIRPR